jgi:1-acyl-sn-glycerol-3-phosphate acyltransferase
VTAAGRWQPWVVRGFEAVFRPWMQRRLGGIHLAGLDQSMPADQPVILVANHVSWWDGFLVREVQRRLRPHGPLYTLMGSRQLGRNGFLRRLGVLELDAERPGALKGLLRRLDAERARRPDLSVSMFPQGRIESAGRRPLGLRPGIAHVARRLAPATVLPVALRFEPLTTPGPHAFVSVGQPIPAAGLQLAALEEALTSQLDAIGALLDAYGEDAVDHWPRGGASLPGVVAQAKGDAA